MITYSAVSSNTPNPVVTSSTQHCCQQQTYSDWNKATQKQTSSAQLVTKHSNRTRSKAEGTTQSNQRVSCMKFRQRTNNVMTASHGQWPCWIKQKKSLLTCMNINQPYPVLDSTHVISYQHKRIDKSDLHGTAERRT